MSDATEGMVGPFEVVTDPRMPPGTFLVGDREQLDVIRKAVYECCDALLCAPHRPGCPVGYYVDAPIPFDPKAVVRIVVTP